MKKIWFKAKKYGYGWTPCTWQGWLILAAYIGIILLGARTIDVAQKNIFKGAGVFFLIDIAATMTLVIVARIYGEKSSWRWGGKDENKNGK